MSQNVTKCHLVVLGQHCGCWLEWTVCVFLWAETLGSFQNWWRHYFKGRWQKLLNHRLLFRFSRNVATGQCRGWHAIRVQVWIAILILHQFLDSFCFFFKLFLFWLLLLLCCRQLRGHFVVNCCCKFQCFSCCWCCCCWQWRLTGIQIRLGRGLIYTGFESHCWTFQRFDFLWSLECLFRWLGGHEQLDVLVVAVDSLAGRLKLGEVKASALWLLNCGNVKCKWDLYKCEQEIWDNIIWALKLIKLGGWKILFVRLNNF